MEIVLMMMGMMLIMVLVMLKVLVMQMLMSNIVLLVLLLLLLVVMMVVVVMIMLLMMVVLVVLMLKMMRCVSCCARRVEVVYGPRAETRLGVYRPLQVDVRLALFNLTYLAIKWMDFIRGDGTSQSNSLCVNGSLGSKVGWTQKALSVHAVSILCEFLPVATWLTVSHGLKVRVALRVTCRGDIG